MHREGRPPRPDVGRRREAILQAARTVFLREGFAASIDRVAAEANVSRRTVFNLFASKDALFSEVLSDPILKAVDRSSLEGDLPLEDALRRFAENYAQIALSQDMVQMVRLVHAEYPRFPDLVSELASHFITQMHPPLVAFLKRKVQEGEIISIDCEAAAEQFLSSVLGRERDRIALGVKPDSRAKRKGYLDQMVALFVRGIRRPSAAKHVR